MNREVHEKKKQMKQQNEKKVKYGELSPWKKNRTILIQILLFLNRDKD